MCCQRSPVNIRDCEEDEGEEFQGGYLRDFKRVRSFLCQVNFLHEGLLSLELAAKFYCAGLGPGDEIEAVDNFISLSLWFYFKIYLTS